MKATKRRGWRCTVVSPKLKSALCGGLVGAGLCFVLVAAPLWLVGGGSVSATAPAATPLAALSTMPAESSQFDITGLLVGDWVGEMCPDEGEPVVVHFEFAQDNLDGVHYEIVVDGLAHSEGTLRSGACDVDGEDLAFHTFLAILNDCDDACGVDRLYQGHFDDGALVGSYTDEVMDQECRSCVGGGTWWLEPVDDPANPTI